MYYLYLKVHNVTGLKYLGQTKSKDPFTYQGSGKRWRNHIAVYGYDVSTIILLQTGDFNELKETGIFFSNLFDVVKSPEWANLKEESGDGGWDHITNNKDYISWCKLGGRNSPTTIPKKFWFVTGDQRTSEMSKLANKIKSEKLKTDSEYKKEYYRKVSNYQKEHNSMKNRNWCVPIDCKDKKKEMKVFHKDNIPEGWIKCSDFNESKSDFNESKKDKSNPAYGKMWIHNLNLKQNSYINKNEIIPDGWIKGRKMKF